MGRIPAAVTAGALAGAVLLAVAQTEPEEIIGTTGGAYESFTPAEVVNAGLPDRTGHGGECTTVKDDATGYEYKACGGGGAALSTDTPKVEAGAGNVGKADDASRGDHVHPQSPLSAFGTVGAAGNCAKANATRDGLRYGDCGSPRALSNANPKGDGTVAPGSSSQVSRGDHVHPGSGSHTPLSDGTPRNLGLPASGTGSAASRADHVHSQTSFLGVGSPAALGAAGKTGVSSLSSRNDHVHPTTGLRQVPDPTHIADGHVLTVKSGADAWAAPSGGGSGGGSGAWDLELLGTYTGSGSAPSFSVPITSFSDGDILALSTDSFAFINVYYLPLIGVPETASACASTCVVSRGLFGTSNAISNNNGTASISSLAFTATSVTARFRQFEPPTKNFKLYRLRPAGGGGGGSATPLSDGLPKALATAAAGVGTAASRGDHVHPLTGLFTDAEAEPTFTDIEATIAALERQTSDIQAAPISTDNPVWTNNAALPEGLIVTAATPPPQSGYAANTVTRPNAGWATDAKIIVKLLNASNPQNYRVTEGPGGSASWTYLAYGGSWRGVTDSDPAFDYYEVGEVGEDLASVHLQSASGNHIGQTTYAGNPTVVRQWAKDDTTQIPNAKFKGIANPTGIYSDGMRWSLTGCQSTGATFTCNTSWQPPTLWRDELAKGSVQDCCVNNFNFTVPSSTLDLHGVMETYTYSGFELYLRWGNDFRKFNIAGPPPGVGIPANGTSHFWSPGTNSVGAGKLTVAPTQSSFTFDSINTNGGTTVSYWLYGLLEVR